MNPIFFFASSTGVEINSALMSFPFLWTVKVSLAKQHLGSRCGLHLWVASRSAGKFNLPREGNKKFYDCSEILDEDSKALH